MGALFWMKRFLLAAVPLAALLAAVEWFKGSTAREDYLSAGAWALIAAAVAPWAIRARTIAFIRRATGASD